MLGTDIMKEIKRYDDGNGCTRRELVDAILILVSQQPGGHEVPTKPIGVTSDSARRAAEEIVRYVASSDDAEPADSDGSPTNYIAKIIERNFAATPADNDAATRLRAFFNDDYTLIARHFKDTTKDRDITGDVEDLLNAAK